MVKKVLAKIFLGIVLLLLYMPILWMVLFSFTDTTSINVWSGFSLEPYAKLFNGDYSSEIASALGYTAVIAIASAALATLLGTLGAIGLHYMRSKKLKNVYSTLSQTPMINAEIVTAVALMLMFTMLKTVGLGGREVTLLNVILSHTCFSAPYVMLNVLPRLRRMDNSVYEAALDLGCKPTQAIRKVVVPELIPGIVMGFIMAFTLSIDDFIITKFTITGADFNTLSTLIYGISTGKKPLPVEIRALSAIIFVVILVMLIAIDALNNKNKNKRKAKGAVK